MKTFINENSFIKNYSHLWFNSIYTHNLSDDEYVKNHEAVIENYLNDLWLYDKDTFEQYRKLAEALTIEYKKKVANSSSREEKNEKIKEFEEELKNLKLRFIETKDYRIFTIDEAKFLFSAVMALASRISNMYNVKYPGFRFAINGGKSINNKSLSVSTWPMLCIKKGISIEQNMREALRPFAAFVNFSFDKADAVLDKVFKNIEVVNDLENIALEMQEG